MWRKWGRKGGFLILGYSDFEISFNLSLLINRPSLNLRIPNPEISKSEISKFLTLSLRHAKAEYGRAEPQIGS